MSKKDTPTAQRGGTPSNTVPMSTDVAKALSAFVDSVNKVKNGVTFTVNAPKGITVNGRRYEQGDSAPIQNAKLCGWSIAYALISEHAKDIATWVATTDGAIDALTESAPIVTKGYTGFSHADRATALLGVVASGKSTTADALVLAVQNAHAARKGNGSVKSTDIPKSLDDLLGDL